MQFRLSDILYRIVRRITEHRVQFVRISKFGEGLPHFFSARRGLKS